MAGGEDRSMIDSVAVIIPAYNEGPRIGQVLDAIIQVPEVAELVVVDDASTDDTARIAASYGAQVVNLPDNRGKGYALCAGVAATQSPILVFLDADLIDLQPKHITALLEPVRTGRAAMSVGVLDDRKEVLWYRSKFSGQRAMTRWFFDSAVRVCGVGYGMERAFNDYAQESGADVEYVSLPGIRSPSKLNKWGMFTGTTKVLSDLLQRSPASRAFLVTSVVGGSLLFLGLTDERRFTDG